MVIPVMRSTLRESEICRKSIWTLRQSLKCPNVAVEVPPSGRVPAGLQTTVLRGLCLGRSALWGMQRRCEGGNEKRGRRLGVVPTGCAVYRNIRGGGGGGVGGR